MTGSVIISTYTDMMICLTFSVISPQRNKQHDGKVNECNGRTEKFSMNMIHSFRFFCQIKAQTCEHSTCTGTYMVIKYVVLCSHVIM